MHMDDRTRYRRYPDDEPTFADQNFRGVREGVRDDPYGGGPGRERHGMGRRHEPHGAYANSPYNGDDTLPRRSQRARHEYLPDHERGTLDRDHSLQGRHGMTDRYFGFGRPRDEQAHVSGGGFLQSVKRAFRGPKGYKRSDARILEDVSDRLAEQSELDPSDIEVSVTNGEVTLRGFVSARWEKFRAEELADHVSGVSEVHNQLRLRASPVTYGVASSPDTSAPASSPDEQATRARIPRA
jgi:hyperosmotically inducible periplasmic protein